MMSLLLKEINKNFQNKCMMHKLLVVLEERCPTTSSPVEEDVNLRMMKNWPWTSRKSDAGRCETGAVPGSTCSPQSGGVLQ